MQHWPPNLASEHTEPSWCASAFLVASSWDTWDPVSFSLWQQSMGQCGYSFLSTTNKVTQRLSVLYQRLSSSSSFLSSSKQHVEGDILFTIGARSLHQRTLFCLNVEQYLSILSPYLYDALFSWYVRQSLDIFSIWRVVEHFVNFVALQMSVYYHTVSTPFYSVPHSLSASGNLILLRTRVPPPRQLTFPLIHSEVPGGVNNCTPVYSHYTTSTDLIQLLKVAAENLFLFTILFTGMLIMVDCVVGNVSGLGKEGEHAGLYLPRFRKM